METQTIESQMHADERNRPERPWSGFLQGPDEVTWGGALRPTFQMQSGIRTIGPYRLHLLEAYPH